MKKMNHPLRTRLTALLLTLVCVLGLLPSSALAAGPSTIKLERFGYYGVSYESAKLGHCLIHQMFYDFDNQTAIGFCGTKGAAMNNNFRGHTWNNPRDITDPTVKMMMGYYYSHSTGKFTDVAISAGVSDVWDAGYTWYMNAWVQAIIWRYKAGTMRNPVEACAEELMYVYNSLEGTHFTNIDQAKEGHNSFRDRAQYIFDLGAQGAWGDCAVYEYTYAGSGSGNVQKIIIGKLNITSEKYTLIVKKVDSSNPSKGLPGAGFHIESANGSYSKDVVTGSNGTYTLDNLEAGTYAVTETAPPPGGYMVDNPGPQYVTLPSGSNKTVTVTFSDTIDNPGEGSIRKVDADNPTRGLSGAVIKITGVDNSFTGTYITGEGGYLTDVPWKDMPVGSYTAEEVTPPEGYTKSPDQSKVKQSFHWDGKHDVALVFENDSTVKVRLIKLDDSNNPLPGAVFNIFRDGQLIGTEATKEDGSITVTDVTEGMYAFVEVSAPKPYAKLTEPVIAHVDQATINGGGTITVTASDKRLPNLTILKRDPQIVSAVIAAGAHDIGKVGIPDCILLKEGRLDSQEFDVIKRHPEIGADILRKIHGFEEIATRVLHHHERWDGTGYPDGQAGLEIPLVSRMIALCDSIDAMRSNRSYREGMTDFDCRREIEKNSGIMYDPELTSICLSNWDFLVGNLYVNG